MSDTYDRLRAIGVSVESADAVSPPLRAMPRRKREAVFLWLTGHTWREIAKRLKMSEETIGGIFTDLEKCFSF